MVAEFDKEESMEMRTERYRITKAACFLTSASMAIPAVLSPLLFTTFHEKYGISYSLLGFLVVLNFATQLFMDLIYSFFQDKLNLRRSVKLTPFVITVGLLLYAAAPVVFPGSPYTGLALGTIIFSAGGGLSEVLTSPVIAKLPSKHPERTLSRLHSCYAWGVLAVVVVSAGFMTAFGNDNWQSMTLLLTMLPMVTCILMIVAPIPELGEEKADSGAANVLRSRTAVLYLVCIFFAGASESTMSQWASSYLETAFGINKTVGDLLGLALFGAAIGLGRTLYSKYGKGIDRILLFGALGTTACYAVAALSDSAAAGLVACAMTGFFVSMLWPGSLIAVTNKVPNVGVALFALMAVGGDLGATFYPQIVGVITDSAIRSGSVTAFAQQLGYTAEQFGMKAGMCFAVLGPLFGSLLFYRAMKIPPKAEE